jgi:hypothetical protein
MTCQRSDGDVRSGGAAVVVERRNVRIEARDRVGVQREHVGRDAVLERVCFETQPAAVEPAGDEIAVLDLTIAEGQREVAIRETPCDPQIDGRHLPAIAIGAGRAIAVEQQVERAAGRPRAAVGLGRELKRAVLM